MSRANGPARNFRLLAMASEDWWRIILIHMDTMKVCSLDILKNDSIKRSIQGKS